MDKAFNFAYEKYQWEPIELTTPDGYVLTSFIISKAYNEEMPNPPVIIQHGNGQDGAMWLQALKADGLPFFFNIVNNGFPVWLMNSRGTDYSRKHVSFELTSPEFWNFDLFDMWQDIEGNIKTIKAYTGYDTFWYIGYSSATSQMLYAMQEQSPKLQRKLRKSILLAPCTVPEYSPPGALKIWKSGIDVYEFGGPSWETDQQKACTVIPESECDQLNAYNRNQATSIKMNSHIA